MNRSTLYLLIFALLCASCFLTQGTVLADGTVPPIITEGTPPDGWKDGVAPWVTNGSFLLPQTDPFGDTESVAYVVHVQGVEHKLQGWNQVFDLLKGGAVNGSIWRQTWANIDTPIGNPTEAWCAGSEAWILDGSFKLPVTDSCQGQATYQVDINGQSHKDQTWQQVKQLTQDGTLSASIWRVQQTEEKNIFLFLPLISR